MRNIFANKNFTISIFCLLAMGCNILLAQETDSKEMLLQKISNAKEDTAKVLLLISIGQQYENGALDSAAIYYRAAGALSEKLNFDFGRLKYIFNYTYLLNIQSKYDESLVLNLNGIEIAQRLGNENELAKAYNNTGSVYLNRNDLKNAINFFLKAEPIFERVDNSQALGQLYNNLSAAYFDLKEFDKGFEFGNKGYLLAKKLDDGYSMAQGLLNSGNSLANLNKYDESLQRLTEAAAINRKMKDFPSLTNALLSIGNVYQKQNNFHLIKPYYDEALVLSKQNEDQRSIATAYLGLADYYFFKREFKNAGKVIDSALNISQANDLKDIASQCLRLKASLAMQQGDVVGYYRLYHLSDSLESIVFNDKIVRNTQELEVQYQTKKKEQQLQLQHVSIRQKNIIALVLGGLLFAFAAIIFLGYRNSQQKRKLQQQRIVELETEKQLLATEAVLKGQDEERSRLAKDLHDGLGGMLSGIKFSFTTMKGNLVMTAENALAFERSMDMLDSSIKELRMVAHNLMPESLIKFGLDTALKDFCGSVSNSGIIQLSYHSFGMEEIQVEQTAEINLYRIIQELVNNILKHAAASEAIVQLQVSGNELQITVEDNGKGFDTGAINISNGMGWANIHSRVEYLKGNIVVQAAPGKGTSVNITIPVVAK